MARRKKKETPSKPREVRLEDFESLDAAMRAVGEGGLVELYEGPCNEWRACSQGVIVRVGDYECSRFLPNGRDLLYSGCYDDWRVHLQGVMVRIGDYKCSRFLLNGRTLQYGENPAWRGGHPNRDWELLAVDVVVRDGDGKLSRPNRYSYGDPSYRRRSMYDGPYYRYWDSHPQGFVVRVGDSEWSRLLLNGHKLLYEGHFYHCELHPRGFVVIEKDIEKDCVSSRFLLNGRDLLYEGPYIGWCHHRQGIVVRVGDSVSSRFLLNGRDLLYEGPCDDCRQIRQGFVVCVGDNVSSRFLLNGRDLLYEGPHFSWDCCLQNVVVEAESEPGHRRLLLVVGRLANPFGPQPGVVVPDWIQEP